MTFLAASSLAESAAEEISLGEAVADGLMNMVVGLGVVFIVLIFLSFVISLFKYINKLDKPKAKTEPVVAPVGAPAPSPAAAVPAGPGTMANAKVAIADEVEGPVAAVILAAVAESCGGNFKVTSIKKSK